MKRMLTVTVCLLCLVACHENLAERAAREARAYTRQYCPTPVINDCRTDSVSFDVNTKTYHYYCAVDGRLDDERVMRANHDAISRGIVDGIRQNTTLKASKEAGFNFEYVLYSIKDPTRVYFRATYSPRDYQ